MVEELPQFQWRLSAPESLVLLWGPETGDAWALKVALLELVVRRAFLLSAVEQRRLLRSAKSVNVLTPGGRSASFSTRALQVIVETHPQVRATGAATGVPVTELAKTVFTRHYQRVRRGLLGKRWDRSGGGYVEADVLPELARQGLYASDTSVRLGHFASTRWQLTTEGNAALEELRRLMAFGRESFGPWVERDPERATAYVERAGPVVLLLGGMAPLIRRLRSRTEEGGDRWRLERPADVPAGMSAGWGGDPFTVDALAGAFGPGPSDDFDVAFFTLSNDVDRAWDELLRGGGFLIFSGE